MTPDLTFRPMTVADVPDVVRIHGAGFKGFFLTFLGPGFLRQLYLGVVKDPSGIAVVAESNGAPIGFVVGTSEPAGLYKRLLRLRLVPFAFYAALAVLRKPSAAPRLLRALTRSKHAPDPSTRCGEMMSLAVLPSAQVKGVGTHLVEEFIAELRRRNALGIVMTTDALNNDKVNRLYIHLGFNRSRTFTTPEGRQMNEYRIDIGPEPQA